MNRWIDGACRGIEAVIAAMLAVMVVLVFGNVVLRYGFNSGITASEEVSRWLFIWMTFLGAVVALREHGHLGVDMVVQRLPRAGKKACLLVGHVVMLYIVWLLFQGSVAQARINWDVTAPTTGASMAIVSTAVSSRCIRSSSSGRAITVLAREPRRQRIRLPRPIATKAAVDMTITIMTCANI